MPRAVMPMRQSVAAVLLLLLTACGPGQSVVNVHVIANPPVTGVTELVFTVGGRPGDRKVMPATATLSEEVVALVFDAAKSGEFKIEVNAIGVGKPLYGWALAVLKPSSTQDVKLYLCKADEKTSCADGCVDLRTSDSNCGACGTVCNAAHATPHCRSGRCSIDPIADCDPGWGFCDGKYEKGCATNLLEDPVHCGSCANACPQLPHTKPTCSAGKCVVTCESTDWGNCDGDESNGCETNLKVTVTACGGCGKGYAGATMLLGDDGKSLQLYVGENLTPVSETSTVGTVDWFNVTPAARLDVTVTPRMMDVCNGAAAWAPSARDGGTATISVPIRKGFMTQASLSCGR